MEKILEKFIVFVHEEILDPFSGVACFGLIAPPPPKP
jgi:hypothetical protein